MALDYAHSAGGGYQLVGGPPCVVLLARGRGDAHDGRTNRGPCALHNLNDGAGHLLIANIDLVGAPRPHTIAELQREASSRTVRLQLLNPVSPAVAHYQWGNVLPAVSPGAVASRLFLSGHFSRRALIQVLLQLPIRTPGTVGAEATVNVEPVTRTARRVPWASELAYRLHRVAVIALNQFNVLVHTGIIGPGQRPAVGFRKKLLFPAWSWRHKMKRGQTPRGIQPLLALRQYCRVSRQVRLRGKRMPASLGDGAMPASGPVARPGFPSR